MNSSIQLKPAPAPSIPGQVGHISIPIIGGPRFRAKRAPITEDFLDQEKIGAFREYLKTLGCECKRGSPNPLADNEHLTSLAIAKYKETFGCLPTQNIINAQKIFSLARGINTAYGGFIGMREADARGRIPLKEGAPAAQPLPRSGDAAETDKCGEVHSSASARLTDPQKLEEFSAYLKELCIKLSNGRKTKPLHNREALGLAIAKYMGIFGCLPSHAGLASQRMLYFYEAIRVVYGGVKGMKDADALGEFDLDNPRAPLVEAGIGEAEKPAAKKRPRASSLWKDIPAPKRPLPFLGNRTVFLDAESCDYSQEEIDAAAQFLINHPERFLSKEGFGERKNVFFSINPDGMRISISEDPREGAFCFREKELPALVFISVLEEGQKDGVELAVREFASEMKVPRENRPEWLRAKTIAAYSFYKRHFENDGSANLDRERFSDVSIDLLNCIFLRKDPFLV